jgi:hypothetical protein
MTARQPGEGRQGAKVSPETGTMWRTTAQPTAALLGLPSAPHVDGRTTLKRTSSKSIFVGVALDALIEQVPMPPINPHEEVRA